MRKTNTLRDWINNFNNKKNSLLMLKSGSISSPGRICLFGEHQDYLGLPVIPMAINKRLYLNYQLNECRSSEIIISSKQLEQVDSIITSEIPQLTGSPYDYLKSVFLYFWKDYQDILLSKITINSEIPIQSGLSSSAALLVPTVLLISNVLMGGRKKKVEIAEIAYYCEHDILNVSCGRMDQYASSIGGIFHMTSQDSPEIKFLSLPKKAFFIVGNSEIKRKADIPLKNVQNDIFRALRSIKNVELTKLTNSEVNHSQLSELQKKRLTGVIGVRNNTIKAFNELKKKNIDLNNIGKLINEQQTFLRENYKVSHPKLDKMCNLALNQGALGAKLTGAGFGGSMFAIADEEDIAIKIRNSLNDYGLSFISQIDSGVKID
jgi:galactokinase